MTKLAEKQRLCLMDDLKLVAAYFVVFIHCVFPGDFGIAVKAVARFAVPYFFLCSGFFLYGNSCERILKKALHIFKLILLSTLLYLFVELGILALQRDIHGMIYHLLRYADWNEMKLLILYNAPLDGTHLWYLFAMLYVYGIFAIFAKCKVPESFVGISAVVLLTVHLVLWHTLLVQGITDSTYYVRNFLFVGYPFVGIGMMLRKYREKLPTLKLPAVLLVLAAGGICSAASRFAFGNKSVPFGAALMAVTLLVFSVTAQRPQKAIVANAGKYSLYIYILHPLVQRGCLEFASAAGLPDGLVEAMAPILVCVLSTVLAILCTNLQERFLQKG